MTTRDEAQRVVAPVLESVLELIGDTPLVRLSRSSPSVRVWAKCEHLSPGGSVKDRICYAMIEAAEANGRLRAGQAVAEATSGNTGIGLAIVCAVKRHPLVLTMPRSMSLERRQLLEAYGAELVLTSPERGMEGAIEARDRLAAERSAFVPSQFDNPVNPLAHERTTALEILSALGKLPTAVVAGVGTGGTLTGVGRALIAEATRTKTTRPRMVAVDPAASPVLTGGPPGPSKIQGLNAGFIPANYDASLVDEVIAVSDEDAYATKQRLAREEGLLVGISAGANVWAAVKLAERLGAEHASAGLPVDGLDVVTFLCDTGERYFSLDTHFRDLGSRAPATESR
jgi:cysteine synthase A